MKSTGIYIDLKNGDHFRTLLPDPPERIAIYPSFGSAGGNYKLITSYMLDWMFDRLCAAAEQPADNKQAVSRFGDAVDKYNLAVSLSS